MSMIGNFLRISPDTLETLIADPNGVEALLYPESDEAPDGNLDIDKAWHGIHFILTGTAWEGDGPLAMAVMGGTEIGEDVGYGPATYLTPDEVSDVAAALEPLTPEAFRARFDPTAMAAASIYAMGDSDPGEDLGYLDGYFTELRTYYLETAAQGWAMLRYVN